MTSKHELSLRPVLDLSFTRGDVDVSDVKNCPYQASREQEEQKAEKERLLQIISLILRLIRCGVY